MVNYFFFFFVEKKKKKETKIQLVGLIINSFQKTNTRTQKVKFIGVLGKYYSSCDSSSMRLWLVIQIKVKSNCKAWVTEKDKVSQRKQLNLLSFLIQSNLISNSLSNHHMGLKLCKASNRNNDFAVEPVFCPNRNHNVTA